MKSSGRGHRGPLLSKMMVLTGEDFFIFSEGGGKMTQVSHGFYGDLMFFVLSVDTVCFLY